MKPAVPSSTGLILFLIGLYLAFVVWMYVAEPVLLGVFAAAIAILWLRDALPRAFERFFGHLQPQTGRPSDSSPQ
jgi:hypothetical protein